MNIISRKEAKTKGLPRYYTGKPCKHGHVAERFVSNRNCYKCLTKEHKKYVENNASHIQEYNKQFRKDNKEHIKQSKKEWHIEHKEENNKRSVDYGKHKPEKIAYLAAKKRARKLKATPAWHETNLIKHLYKKRDELSKLWNIELHVDHIVPLQSNIVCGLHCWDNLQLLEASLNNSKYNSFIS